MSTFFSTNFSLPFICQQKKEVSDFPDLHCHDKLRDVENCLFVFSICYNNLIILFGMVDDGSAEMYLHVRCSFSYYIHILYHA